MLPLFSGDPIPRTQRVDVCSCILETIQSKSKFQESHDHDACGCVCPLLTPVSWDLHTFSTLISCFSVDCFGAWHEGSGISACEKSLEWQRSLQLMLKLSQRSLEGNPGFKTRYGSGGLGKAQ